MPKLTKLTASLITFSNNGSGLDHDSTLTFNLHSLTSFQPFAIITFNGTDGAGGSTHEGDTKTFDIPLQSNALGIDQINKQSILHININAVGRDHYAGTLQLVFTFDDGSFHGFRFGDFAVGTYGESNSTGQLISFFDYQNLKPIQ